MDFSIDIPMCKLTQNNHLKDFSVLDRVGSGSYANVYKILNNKSKQVFALKVIQAGKILQRDKLNALNEIRLLASLQNSNIIQYKDSFFDEQSNSLCIVLQFAEKGDLASLICDNLKAGTLIEEKIVWKALVNISLGLMTMHKNKIAHRDMKPANVLLNKDSIFKIGDLNVSKILKKQVAETITGTPYYMSPQIWKGKPYDQKVDIWSLGCIIYEMACGKPPFVAETKERLKQKICIGSYAPIPKFYSGELWEMIKSMLKLNKKLRPSASEILKSKAAIKHYQGNIQKEMEEMELKQKTDLLKTIVMKNQLAKVKFPEANYGKKELENEIYSEREQKQGGMHQKYDKADQKYRRRSQKSVDQIKYENGRISSQVIKERINCTRLSNIQAEEIDGKGSEKFNILAQTKKKSISFFNAPICKQKSTVHNCMQGGYRDRMCSSRSKQNKCGEGIAQNRREEITAIKDIQQVACPPYQDIKQFENYLFQFCIYLQQLVYIHQFGIEIIAVNTFTYIRCQRYSTCEEFQS